MSWPKKSRELAEEKAVRRLALRLVLVLVLAVSASAQCTSAEYRQFDFWVGEWDVEVGGVVVAQSRIEKSADGCIVVENWTPQGGGEGKSWNFYNASARVWEQVWVTSLGGVVKVAGGLTDGAMREEGIVQRPGGNAMHRHSFTPVGSDRVRQFCEESSDSGKTWQTTFNGVYVRRLPATR